MKKFNSFKELADDTLAKVIAFGITSRTVIGYSKFCIAQLSAIMAAHNVIFDKTFAFEWLKLNDFNPGNMTTGSKNSLYRSCRRTIFLLDDNFNGTLNEWKIYTSIHQRLPSTQMFMNIINKYREHLINCDYAEATVNFKFRCANNLLLHLENSGIFDIKQCNHKKLADYFVSEHFMNRKPSGVAAEVIRVKHFIIFLEENNYVFYSNLHYAVPVSHVDERKIISIFNEHHKHAVLQDYLTFPTNLRNRAAYLLALHCGLRTSDIIDLKFSNIDWDNKLLTIILKKTKINLTIPIDNETVNALIDYILIERRKSDLENIFISAIGPKRKTKCGSFTTGLRFKCLDDDYKPEQYGMHIMRRTFASDLLRKGVSLSVISSALGHEDKERVNEYLFTDEKNMKLCSLEIDEFPYNGGLF